MFHVKHYFPNTYNNWIVLKHFISFYGYEMHCTHKNLFIYTFLNFSSLNRRSRHSWFSIFVFSPTNRNPTYSLRFILSNIWQHIITQQTVSKKQIISFWYINSRYSFICKAEERDVEVDMSIDSTSIILLNTLLFRWSFFFENACMKTKVLWAASRLLHMYVLSGK